MKNKTSTLLFVISLILIIFSCKKKVDGIPQNYKYKTVKIGNQIWMAENLNTTTFRNGDKIPEITNPYDWKNNTLPAYCNYGNDVENAKIYGRLYNQAAMEDSRNIAPKGWHVPSFEEWNTLLETLDGTMWDATVVDKLKQAGYDPYWSNSYDNNGTNSSGFTAIGSGYRDLSGEYQLLKAVAKWWSTTDGPTIGGFSGGKYIGISILPGSEGPISDLNYSNNGFAIRCIKD
jgi:uncharacterized protein (TIGR02145 family)